jgi:hypothetical protein
MQNKQHLTSGAAEAIRSGWAFRSESARNGKESVVESRDGSASPDCALRGPTFPSIFAPEQPDAFVIVVEHVQHAAVFGSNGNMLLPHGGPFTALAF